MEQERAGRRVREMWIYSSLDLLSQYLLLAISLYIHTRRRPKKKKKTVATWRRAAEKLIAFSLAKCPRWGGRGLAKNSLVHTISPKRDLRSFIISEKKKKRKIAADIERISGSRVGWLDANVSYIEVFDQNYVLRREKVKSGIRWQKPLY